MWIAIRDALSAQLFVIGNQPITASTLFTVVFILVLTVWVSRLVRRLFEGFAKRRGGRPGVVGTISGLMHYSILVIGFGIALGTAGIDLTALFAAGAIFAVGLGFAMQSIAQNFVAGVILLTERAIKPGDVLVVEDQVVRVVDMGIRASIAQSRDGEDLIIPNAVLIQTTVKNFTLKESNFRIRASVGVAYRSDMNEVRATLEAVAAEVSKHWSVSDRKAQVIITGFGDNSVNWEVAIWMNDPWEARPALSDLHQALWWALLEKDITIAFPQLDVHLTPKLEQAFIAQQMRHNENQNENQEKPSAG